MLAKYLPKDRPLYYLPPTRSASVEVIAAHYVKEIKQLQPHGPYCISGFCEGGNVAFEIAHQLEAQGDKVSALVLFEYYSPYAVIQKKSFKYFKRRLSYYKRRFVYLRK
ncbi:MAG TPA: thioesterase domain-containing protein, partial [Flavitalea sp.]|nr:thioesterase domain-containing protein [Flavitalea sp.]